MMENSADNYKKTNRGKPGEIPGKYEISANSQKSKLIVYAYAENFLEKFESLEIAEAIHFIDKHHNKTIWLDVEGLGTKEVFDEILKKFEVNPLTIEDIVKTYQRPKMEDYHHYLFLTSRMINLNKGLQLNNEQLSFLLFKNVLITFQEDDDDILDPVRQRLENYESGNMRNLGPSYLLYALMDTIIDHYFTVINRLGDELEIVEDHLYQKVQKLLMYRIQAVKKLLLGMRRAAWPERDKLNEILRSNDSLIHNETKVFFRDAYDHSIQIIDLIESYKELSTSLLDLYLSMMSNKMNEVMKFLTIVSSIFIPLTFIAGIYGMNFSYQDPKTGKILPHNMPELYWQNGYYWVLGIMLLIALLQILYFARRGWFKN